MRVGVMVLPEWRSADAAAMWRAVEEMGFDSGWTVDHFQWRSLMDGPWYSTFTFLAVAAMSTSSLRVGTLVVSPNFRHPVLTAKDAMSLDDVSGGRFSLGIGAGSTLAGDAWVIDDRTLTARERFRRFDEFVRVTDRLLREPVVSHRGEFYLANEARMIPGCVQRPRLPILVAGTGHRGLRLAAEVGDSWASCGPIDVAEHCPPERLMESVRVQSGLLEDACRAIGRDPRAIGRVLVTTEQTNEMTTSPQRLLDTAVQLNALGVTDLVVQWPRREGMFAGAANALERISAEVLDDIHALEPAATSEARSSVTAR